MQKLKNAILDKLIEEKVTSSELNLLIYMSRRQSLRGSITGVYYKSACEELAMSYQGFYDALRGLEKKNIIMLQKRSYYDWDVLILDNDFTYPEAQKEGYINTGHDLYGEADFYALKAGEKLLTMYLMRSIGAINRKAFCVGAGKFYEKYTKMFGVTKRVLQTYLCSIKKFFLIGIKEGKYYMTPRKSVYKDKTPTERAMYAEQIARAAFRRNLIKDEPEDIFKNVVDLVKQYYYDYEASIKRCFMEAFQKSLYLRNKNKPDKYKWDRKLQLPYIHKLLRQELGLENGL